MVTVKEENYPSVVVAGGVEKGCIAKSGRGLHRKYFQGTKDELLTSEQVK